MRFPPFARLLTAGLMLAASGLAAQAQDAFNRYEIRGGLFVHDPVSPEKGSVDINAEFLSPRLPIQGGAWQVLVPRLHLGGTMNTAGKTSHGYTGLTWDYDLSKSLFVEASLGGDLNNGKTGNTLVSGRNAMGCAAAFRESASLGYRLSQSVSLMGTIEHVSNAGFCERNRGLTNMGLRLGYSF
jgi:lipid A 3-O-deacylase